MTILWFHRPFWTFQRALRTRYIRSLRTIKLDF
nr:MAG TPA: hypothetical protein [Caudoviricetes sp.]DAT69719.1 MAG TPA: hypothetical protein [Caudoviricetes sp.]